MAVLFEVNKNPDKMLTFTNGVVIPASLPAAQDIKGLDLKGVNLCSICPIQGICHDGNYFDCLVYGMFDGSYILIDELLRAVALGKK